MRIYILKEGVAGSGTRGLRSRVRAKVRVRARFICPPVTSLPEIFPEIFTSYDLQPNLAGG